MSNADDHDIVVVGGGIAGLATALALHRIGLRSVVLEAAECLRTTGSAFLLWANAWHALETLGIADQIRHKYYQIHGVRVLSDSSQRKVENSLRVGETRIEARCVERKAVLETLANALPEGSIRFNSKLISIDRVSELSDSPLFHLNLSDGTSLTAKVLIGCDGVHSRVAHDMGFGEASPTGRSAFRGMAELPAAAAAEVTDDLKWGTLINGKGKRAGFVPCKDNHVFWFVSRKTLPSDAATARDPESAKRSALEALEGFPEEFAENIKLSCAETVTLGELRMRWVWPWQWEKVYGGRGCVVVVGDALHSMWPDLAQGACLALEDAVVLARCLSHAAPLLLSTNSTTSEWNAENISVVEACLRTYRDERKWRVCTASASAFIAGNLLSGWSAVLRFLRDRVLLPLFGLSLLMRFALFKCGTLPLNSNPSHARTHAHFQ